jgi:succinyl-diaminopimelate desuccinylase
MTTADLRDRSNRLLTRTRQFVDIRSESGGEGTILEAVRDAIPMGAFEVLDDEDAVLFLGPLVRRVEAPLVVLAGHVDTVPIGGADWPSRLVGDAIVGRGAADMKAGLAVMLEAALDVAAEPEASEVDLGLLFFGREELPITESALMPLFERCAAASTIDLAIVMEPTGNAIEVGCLGNLNARVMITGKAAHSARPWLGDNAVHSAIAVLAPIADLPVRDVEVDGLVFREVVNVTTIQGGIAANVIPDRVQADINYRYAPSRTPEEAEARIRELLGRRPVDVRIVGNAPPGPVAVSHPLVQRLQRSGDLAVGPKQAWTPVAEFALGGVAAVNFGPGDPKYAHRDDERVEVASLMRSYELMRAFLGWSREPGGTGMGGSR